MGSSVAVHRTQRLSGQTLEDRISPANLPAGFIETILASGLSAPTALAEAPDGRLFITEQAGLLRVVENASLREDPVLSLEVDPRGERGLLGVALHPNFVQQSWIYLYYTVPGSSNTDPFNRVSRFLLQGNQVDPTSEQVLMELDPLTEATNHNGGALHFAQDGTLLIAVGENALPRQSQSLDNLLGKMLRINADGTIPEDNPFADELSGNRRAIWALGLRNPFTFAVQPGSGRIFINDVGQDAFEEINEGIPGANYGWPEVEGPSNNPSYIPPLLAYAHGSGPDEGIAITGGVFYNPRQSTFPQGFTGQYFFTDLGAGWVRVLDPGTGETDGFATGFVLPVDLDVTANGSLLVLQRTSSSGTGQISQIDYTPGSSPRILQEPIDQIVSVGQSVTWTVEATGADPLAYQWFRNGLEIPEGTTPTLSLTDLQLADSGANFQVRISNGFGSTVSRSANLTVTQDAAPLASIDTPSAGSLFTAGETIPFAGSGSDPETGSLSEAAFTWRIDYHTGAVARPFIMPQSGFDSGSFTIPQRTPYLETDVFYRISLTVTDPAGLSTTVTRDLLPRTSTVTLRSDLPDSLRLDGTPRENGFTFMGVAGVVRELSASPSGIANGRRQVFQRYSDGGPRLREFITPSLDQEIRAIYHQAAPLLIAAGNGGPTGVLRREVDIAFEQQLAQTFGNVRVATGDINGDGIPDTVTVASPGSAPVLRVFDGVTNATILEVEVFERSFLGGLFVSVADLNDDGYADMVVAPDQGGGPRTRILDGQNGSTLVDFFGIEDPTFRGGARVATGDIDGDGVPDLLVAAGFGGGPRVAVYDGRSLKRGQQPDKLLEDMFVFESSLRNGVYPTLGDLNGDVQDDLIFGAGPGGGPRVLAWDSRTLLQSDGRLREDLGNFFAGDQNQRGGVPLVAKDLDGDARIDLVTGSGLGDLPFLRHYVSEDGDVPLSGTPTQQELVFNSEFRGGVYVG